MGQLDPSTILDYLLGCESRRDIAQLWIIQKRKRKKSNRGKNNPRCLQQRLILSVEMRSGSEMIKSFGIMFSGWYKVNGG